MNIREAKLNGIRAAAEVHHYLGIDNYLTEGGEFVDVFEALSSLGILTLCRPLEGLLGAYFGSKNKGILVTTNRRLPIQRFTAAHELGHFWLGHEASLDSENTISLARQGVVSVPIQEIEAEAFASEFLLPKRLLVNTAKRQKWNRSDFKNPKNVYQLSLRTGTSYEATWRALFENNLIDFNTAEKIKASLPKVLKKHVLGEVKLDNPWADAFRLSLRDKGANILASPEDIVLIDLPEHSSGGYLWSGLPESGFSSVLNEQQTSIDSAIGSVANRKIYFRAEGSVQIHMEERRPWEVAVDALELFDVKIDFNGKEYGLPRVTRK